MRAGGEQTSDDRRDAQAATLSDLVDSTDATPVDAETGLLPSNSSSNDVPLPTSTDPDHPSSSLLKKSKDKAARILGISSSLSPSPTPTVALPPKLQALIDSFESSSVAKTVKAEIAGLRSNGHGPGGGGGNIAAWDQSGNGGAGDLGVLTGYKRASFLTQFAILSGRAFKNLYRNPMLMAGHFIMSIVVAREFIFLSSSFSVFVADSSPSRLCSSLCWALPRNRIGSWVVPVRPILVLPSSSTVRLTSFFFLAEIDSDSSSSSSPSSLSTL